MTGSNTNLAGAHRWATSALEYVQAWTDISLHAIFEKLADIDDLDLKYMVQSYLHIRVR